MGKWWNPFKGEEAETGGMSWPKQTFVYGTGTNMQQSMSLLLILMETEMLNGFRQFNLGIQSSATQMTFWIQWLIFLSVKCSNQFQRVNMKVAQLT